MSIKCGDDGERLCRRCGHFERLHIDDGRDQDEIMCVICMTDDSDAMFHCFRADAR